MPRLIIPSYHDDMVSLSKALADALRYLENLRGFSPATIESYERACSQFRYYLGSVNAPDDLTSFNGATVRGFAEWLRSRGMKTNSVVIRLSGLSAVADTLTKLTDGRARPYLAKNPTKTFDWPQMEQAETKFLLPDELERFLGVTRPINESIARDLFLDTGLRVSELARANVEDVIDLGGQAVLAVTVKGRGRRRRKLHAPLSPDVAATLRGHLVDRGMPGGPEPLLVNSRGNRWTRSALSGLMARIGQAAGVNRLRVSAHKLRHTANIAAKLGGVDPHVRSALLAHSSPRSLDRYEHVIPVELFEARDRQREGMRRYLGLMAPPVTDQRTP